MAFLRMLITSALTNHSRVNNRAVKTQQSGIKHFAGILERKTGKNALDISRTFENYAWRGSDFGD